MKQRLLKQISGVALAIMLALTVTQILASAQESQDAHLQSAEGSQYEQQSGESRYFSANARKLEGVWESQVTVRVCQTGAPVTTFRGMTLFIRGGSLVAANNNPPTTAGPAFGRWQHLGGRSYNAVFRFFRYNPDGSFAGVQRVTRNFTLSPGDDDFTGTIGIEIFDANDNLIQTGCATETAKRVE